MRARDVVSWAKKNGFTLLSGKTGNDGRMGCAWAAILTMRLGPKYSNGEKNWSLYSPEYARLAGIPYSHLEAIEAGFEDACLPNGDWIQPYHLRRYVKMGQTIAKMAGLVKS